MPPLLCLSPLILDQSFPRNKNELSLVSGVLGAIQELVEEDRIHFVLTYNLRQLVQQFNWTQEQNKDLFDLFRLLNQWFLQPNKRLVEIDVSSINDYELHPLPQSCIGESNSNLWAKEMGRLLTVHDKCCSRNEFFIGVACESAFSKRPKGVYHNPKHQRVFPLVGYGDFNTLDDAYQWDVPNNIHNKDVSFDCFRNNYQCIGGISINPSRGSHYKVNFKGNRPWILDRNDDPIPDKYLKELTVITSYPVPVIKAALIFGKKPEKTQIKLKKFL